MPDENIDDTTSETNDGGIDDNLAFDDDSENIDDESTDESKEGDKSEADERTEKAEKKAKTLQRKYDKLVGRNEELAKRHPPKTKDLTDEEKKERQAEKFIDDKVDKRIEDREKKAKQVDEERVEKLSQELDDVLEENETLSEKEILDLITEFAEDGIQLTPSQAAKRLLKKDETKKEKPKMPTAKRGSGEIKDEPTDKEIAEEKGKSFLEKIELRKRRWLNKNKD